MTRMYQSFENRENRNTEVPQYRRLIMSEMMNNKKAHAKKDFRADPSARKSFVLLIDHSKYRSLIEDRPQRVL